MNYKPVDFPSVNFGDKVKVTHDGGTVIYGEAAGLYPSGRYITPDGTTDGSLFIPNGKGWAWFVLAPSALDQFKELGIGSVFTLDTEGKNSGIKRVKISRTHYFALNNDETGGSIYDASIMLSGTTELVILSTPTPTK